MGEVGSTNQTENNCIMDNMDGTTCYKKVMWRVGVRLTSRIVFFDSGIYVPLVT